MLVKKSSSPPCLNFGPKIGANPKGFSVILGGSFGPTSKWSRKISNRSVSSFQDQRFRMLIAHLGEWA